jgi:hypothetical protein
MRSFQACAALTILYEFITQESIMKTNTPEPDLRILKEGTCSSLSGKSTLTYHIGCNAEAAIQLRVYANTGNGLFSNEWIPLTDILERLTGGFTSLALYPLLRGRSSNTPGFLLAVLLAEGLVHRSLANKGCYDSSDPEFFMAKIKLLIASEDKPQKAVKKPAKPNSQPSL